MISPQISQLPPPSNLHRRKNCNPKQQTKNSVKRGTITLPGLIFKRKT